MISHSHSFIFIHPAKTGGNSIEVALTPYADGQITEYGGGFDPENKRIYIFGDEVKHARLDYWHQFFGAMLGRFYLFATTRNPWDRIISAWAYYNKSYNALDLDEWFSFVAQRLDPPKFRQVRHGTGKRLIDPVLNYVALPERVMQPVRFIRFEKLQEDFDEVCKDLGLPKITLPHTLKTDHEHYSTYYDDERREIVRSRFIKDIEHFGYEFEEQ